MVQTVHIPPITIVGAGLGGLSAALALLRAGHRVSVIEQASALTEVGAGVQLSANATRVLTLLGLGPQLEEIGAEPQGRAIRLWSTGQAWPQYDVGSASRERFGSPYYALHRADLLNLLATAVEATAPGTIKLGVRVTDVDLDGPRPVVKLASGESFEAEVLIGADGVHSRVRAAIVGPDAATYSGCMAWRGVIPMSRLPSHLQEPVAGNWIGPGRHVIHYPLRRGELMNFVGIVEKDVWPAESWAQQGTVDECLADFEGWHENIATLIRSIDHHFKWALMVRPPIRAWARGTAVVMGDAAHPTLPFMAQGAAMAIEDGYVLARCLAAGNGDVAEGLRIFERTRFDRTSRVVEGSAQNAKRFHNPELADAAGAQRYVDNEWQPEIVKRRSQWLFEYRADEVPLVLTEEASAV